MGEKRFVCIDVGYGDDWYITDNGKKLSEMEIVDLLNKLYEKNEQLRQKLKSVTMLKDDYEELIESFEKKYGEKD